MIYAVSSACVEAFPYKYLHRYGRTMIIRQLTAPRSLIRSWTQVTWSFSVCSNRVCVSFLLGLWFPLKNMSINGLATLNCSSMWMCVCMLTCVDVPLMGIYSCPEKGSRSTTNPDQDKGVTKEGMTEQAERHQSSCFPFCTHLIYSSWALARF